MKLAFIISLLFLFPLLAEAGAKCPILVPGKSLDGIHIGQTVEDLKKSGHKVEATDYGTIVDGKYEITRCKNKVITITMLDLSAPPACIELEGKRIPTQAPLAFHREQFNLQKCKTEMLVTGDRLYYCNHGGSVIGVNAKSIDGQFKEIAVDHISVMKRGYRFNSLHLSCPSGVM